MEIPAVTVSCSGFPALAQTRIRGVFLADLAVKTGANEVVSSDLYYRDGGSRLGSMPPEEFRAGCRVDAMMVDIGVEKCGKARKRKRG